jgi:hypothetical protein
LTNQYAALPSMHVGWALWAGAAVALLAPRKLVRYVAAGYPLLVGVVVVVTGNHYVLDALAGAAAVCVMSFLCLRLDDRALTRRVMRSRPRWSRLGHSVDGEAPVDEPARLQHPPVRRNVEERLHSRDGAPSVLALCGLCACRTGTAIDRLWTPAHASIPEDR